MKNPIDNIKWRLRARKYVREHPSVLERSRRLGGSYGSYAYNNDDLPAGGDPLRTAVVNLRYRRDKWRKRRQEWPSNILAGLLVGAGIIGLFAFFVVVGGLLFLFAWNVGVDEIASAAGYDKIENITFIQALAGSVLISVLGRLFRGENKIEVKK